MRMFTAMLAGAMASSLALGACAWSGWAECLGETVNVNSDPNHCGACRYPCPPGILCQEGRCLYSEGLSVCLSGHDEYEDRGEYALAELRRLYPHHDPTDLSQLPQPRGELHGPPDDLWIRRYAADLARDPENCGACGHVCPADATCIDGQCICPAGGVVQAYYHAAPGDASADYVGDSPTVSYYVEPAPQYVDERWWLSVEGQMRVRRECVPGPP